jgi:hypothetical protein
MVHKISIPGENQSKRRKRLMLEQIENGMLSREKE